MHEKIKPHIKYQEQDNNVFLANEKEETWESSQMICMTQPKALYLVMPIKCVRYISLFFDSNEYPGIFLA